VGWDCFGRAEDDEVVFVGGEVRVLGGWVGRGVACWLVVVVVVVVDEGGLDVNALGGVCFLGPEIEGSGKRRIGVVEWLGVSG
jgi:hypothetical protein